MPRLLLPGSRVLPPPRLAKLLASLKDSLAGTAKPASVSAYFIHLIDSNDEIKEDGLNKLKQLLHYGTLEDNKPVGKDDALVLDCLADSASTTRVLQVSDSVKVVIVLPRSGTISPWSSKATDIARSCALTVDRIERGTCYIINFDGHAAKDGKWLEVLFDRMIERVVGLEEWAKHEGGWGDFVFHHGSPKPLSLVPLLPPNTPGTTSIDQLPQLILTTLTTYSSKNGLGLAPVDLSYLASHYSSHLASLEPKPATFELSESDAFLFMFSQVQSEHCRHHVFRSTFSFPLAKEGVSEEQDKSLFDMIRNTHLLNPHGTKSAYSDNAAVLEGPESVKGRMWRKQGEKKEGTGGREWFVMEGEGTDVVAKVETHNHPTLISPYPGASTGSGGEIRDEGAVGFGSRPLSGLTGFHTSDLLIPTHHQPWEMDIGRPGHVASALDIMIQGPLGAAAFNNEFGRPNLTGYFRTATLPIPTSNGGEELRGFHKPVMLAGGIGTIRPAMSHKRFDRIEEGTLLVVLGGPGMLIGLGGGAASSNTDGSGVGDAMLDFASVQRGNPEMQRRAQEVLDALSALDPERNPVLSVHDVGAGGLSNALTELVEDAGMGGKIEIREVGVAETGMSPMEIWCNESQERYVMALHPDGLELFLSICERERCPVSIVGKATKERRLVVTDRLLGGNVIDVDMDVLFGKTPKRKRDVGVVEYPIPKFQLSAFKPDAGVSAAGDTLLTSAALRLLHLPTIASKSFLITIGDRSVSGLVAREQMVGPWQTPLADCAVNVLGFDTVLGEAFATGERPLSALDDPAASARMSVCESLTNLASAHVPAGLERVRLSCNWMAAASHADEARRLYIAVQAVGMDLCPKLGVSVPVGKDSMSMKTSWTDERGKKEVVGPVTLCVSAFGGVGDVSWTRTPDIKRKDGTVLVYLELAGGKRRLGGSCVAQVYGRAASESPNVEDPALFKAWFSAMMKPEVRKALLAYHDVSDGGLCTTVAEMAFGGHCGVEVDLSKLGIGSAKPSTDELAGLLFAEELGAVVQVAEKDVEVLKASLPCPVAVIGRPTFSAAQRVIFTHGSTILISAPRVDLHRAWAATSYWMQAIRDNPTCAQEEFDNLLDVEDPGLTSVVKFDISPKLPSTASLNDRPRVAILREQGVNGHVEMAACFLSVGFNAVDVHMSEILSGDVQLADFVGFAACGGFSYGDVLGAGAGWAKSILFNDVARKEFADFFTTRKDTFALGVCNGCQMVSVLRDLVGEPSWPSFVRNKSEQFEARTSMVEIVEGNPSVFLTEMGGSRFPVAVAHGEGRAEFANDADLEHAVANHQVAIRFVDNRGQPTEQYPYNPNGSARGITGITNANGRVLVLMPHPERCVRSVSNSWRPDDGWGGDVSPWNRMFANARRWVG